MAPYTMPTLENLRGVSVGFALTPKINFSIRRTIGLRGAGKDSRGLSPRKVVMRQRIHLPFLRGYLFLDTFAYVKGVCVASFDIA